MWPSWSWAWWRDSDSGRTRESAALRVFSAAVVLAAFAFLLFRCDPGTSVLFPPCPFHSLTGLHCPGCGSLRAAHSLLHGRILEALDSNPLFVLSVPVLGALVIRRTWRYRVWVPWAALWVLVSYGVLRNVPLWPFFLLAPAN
jgi:hypothetical protein